MYKRHLSIFIPDTLTEETRDPKIKTYKVGIIGRAAAIFKVDEIIIYRDEGGGEAKFIKDILSYMDTPQYLRRKVFPLSPNLKHVGVLPPLRTPHHPVGKPDIGEHRQGLTLKRTRKGTIVDIGAERPALCKEKLTVNKILTFKIIKYGKTIIVEPEEPEDVYWGYTVKDTGKNLEETLKSSEKDVIIATSKYGTPLTSILDEVKSRLKKAHNVAILFGGPYKGLPATIKADFNLNMIPDQGTETVRTEEAVLATLSIFNLITKIQN
ncbi:MAG TPA: putative RNA uridine N3 methyltransferase [Methanothermobacter sp.]|nr:conserved hypothetical protein [Methanothermobacter sp. MT-2]HHW04330.1 RNA-binding protein [Methanothermobacter sp.]HOK72372.1 putative RNA uridine N3 methyltransferase [Methanothermobacter sp.]HOL69225.1 putative RNA uridine N3 methyltransferase [Methanothermobacter sp.]HPQ03859.1 putative RNA uridine N3 methyltransferase [Methanothermobacter sp.]